MRQRVRKTDVIEFENGLTQSVKTFAHIKPRPSHPWPSVFGVIVDFKRKGIAVKRIWRKM